MTGPSELERAEAAWLVDTRRRIALRYSRALFALAHIPAALDRLSTVDTPRAEKATEAAEAIEDAVATAIQQLARLGMYATTTALLGAESELPAAWVDTDLDGASRGGEPG